MKRNNEATDRNSSPMLPSCWKELKASWWIKKMKIWDKMPSEHGSHKIKCASVCVCVSVCVYVFFPRSHSWGFLPSHVFSEQTQNQAHNLKDWQGYRFLQSLCCLCWESPVKLFSPLECPSFQVLMSWPPCLETEVSLRNKGQGSDSLQENS